MHWSFELSWPSSRLCDALFYLLSAGRILLIQVGENIQYIATGHMLRNKNAPKAISTPHFELNEQSTNFNSIYFQLNSILH